MPWIWPGSGIRPGGRYRYLVDSCAIIKRKCCAGMYFTIYDTGRILLPKLKDVKYE
jgi:hypothetical protein